MSSDPRAVVERFFYEAINDRKLEILDEIISPDFRGNILEYEQTWNTREEITEMLANVFVAFPDYHQVIRDWIVQGDKVVARWTTTGTHEGPYSGIAPTGNVIHEHGIDIFQVLDGLTARKSLSLEVADHLPNLEHSEQHLQEPQLPEAVASPFRPYSEMSIDESIHRVPLNALSALREWRILGPESIHRDLRRYLTPAIQPH